MRTLLGAGSLINDVTRKSTRAGVSGESSRVSRSKKEQLERVERGRKLQPELKVCTDEELKELKVMKN